MRIKTKFIFIGLIILVLYVATCVATQYYYTKHFVNNVSNILESEKGIKVNRVSVSKINFYNVHISNLYITKDQSGLIYIKDIYIELSKYYFLVFIPKIKKVTVNNANVDFKVISGLNINSFRENGINIPNQIFLSKVSIDNVPSIKYVEIFSGELKLGATIILDANLLSKKEIGYQLNYSSHTRSNKTSIKLYNQNNNITYYSDNGSIKINGEGTRIDLIVSGLLNNVLPLEESNGNFKIDIYGEKNKDDGSIIFKKIDIDSEVLKVLGTISLSSEGFMIDIGVPLILTSKREVYKVISSLTKVSNIHQFIPNFGNKDGELNIHIDSMNEIIYDTNLNAKFKDSKLISQVLHSSFAGDGKIDVVGNNTQIKNENFLLAKIVVSGSDINQICQLASLKCNNDTRQSRFRFVSHIMLSDYMTIIPSLIGEVGDSHITANFNIKNQDAYDRIRGNIKLDNVNLQNTDLFLQIVADLRYKIVYFNSNIKVQIGDLKVKTSDFKNVTYTISTYDGKLSIRQVNINADELSLKGFIEVKLNTIRPIVKVKLQIDRIDLMKLGLSDHILNLYEYRESDNSIRWKYHHFRFFNEDRLDFDVDLDISLKNIILNNNNIFEKGDVRIILKEFNIDVQKFEFTTIEDGVLLLLGNIYVDSKPTLNLSFHLQNIKTENIMKNIFHLNFVKGGVSNCVGSILSSGNSIEELIYSMSGQFKILSSGFVMHGINYENLIMDIPYINKQSELENLLQIDIFRGKTMVNNHSLEGEIKNGVVKSTGSFMTDYSVDRMAINIILQTLELRGIDIISFQLPQDIMTIQNTSIMMMFKGNIWESKIYFDNDKVYQLIRKSQKRDVLAEILNKRNENIWVDVS